jgi:hypothetical protein
MAIYLESNNSEKNSFSFCFTDYNWLSLQTYTSQKCAIHNTQYTYGKTAMYLNM